MLKFLIFVISILFILAIHYGFTMSFIQRRANRASRIYLALSTVLGIGLAITLFVIKRLEPKKMLNPLVQFNRQLLVGCSILFALAILFGVIWMLSKPKSALEEVSYHVTGLSLSLVLIPLIGHIAPQLMLKTLEFIAFGEDSVGTESFFRFAGYFLGLLLAFLVSLTLYHVLKRLPQRFYKIFFSLFGLALGLDYFLRGVASAARLRLLRTNISWVFEVLILEDKSLPYMVALYGAILLLAAVTVYVLHLRLKGEYETQAKRRKARWWLRNCRRWAVASCIWFACSLVLVTAVDGYLNRPVQLAAAENYQLQGDQIIIPLTQVEDGHLHRFSLNHDGHNIRFIVVRKPNSNAYGVGLDACDICGVAGYFERKDTIVCKRCDVVMNKATIGFKGGCNPVPFPYEIKDSQIVINQADLIKEQDRFPVGD